jgi:hypothetical protein
MYSSCLLYIDIMDNTYFCNLCDGMLRRGIGSEDLLHAGIVTSASDNCETISVLLTFETILSLNQLPVFLQHHSFQQHHVVVVNFL